MKMYEWKPGIPVCAVKGQPVTQWKGKTTDVPPRPSTRSISGYEVEIFRFRVKGDPWREWKSMSSVVVDRDRLNDPDGPTAA